MPFCLMMRAASSRPVASMWSRHGAIAVMPCLRHASMPSFRPNCWRTVARLIDRPAVFMSHARAASRSVCSLSRKQERVGERALGHRVEIRHRTDAEARHVERSNRDLTIPDRDAQTAMRRAMIKIAMRVKKGILFSRRRNHTVDVVMAVALDMGRTDEGGERQILLHRDTGLRGE